MKKVIIFLLVDILVFFPSFTISATTTDFYGDNGTSIDSRKETCHPSTTKLYSQKWSEWTQHPDFGYSNSNLHVVNTSGESKWSSSINIGYSGRFFSSTTGRNTNTTNGQGSYYTLPANPKKLSTVQTQNKGDYYKKQNTGCKVYYQMQNVTSRDYKVHYK